MDNDIQKLRSLMRRTRWKLIAQSLWHRNTTMLHPALHSVYMGMELYTASQANPLSRERNEEILHWVGDVFFKKLVEGMQSGHIPRNITDNNPALDSLWVHSTPQGLTGYAAYCTENALQTNDNNWNTHAEYARFFHAQMDGFLSICMALPAPMAHTLHRSMALCFRAAALMPPYQNFRDTLPACLREAGLEKQPSP